MEPELIEVPEEIWTERLLIRCPRAGDGPAVNEAVIESLAELRPWLSWADHAPTVEESEANARRAVARWIRREVLRMQIFLRDGRTFVGGSGLHEIDWSVPKFDIGYWVRTSLAGRGYITEAVAGITRMAFESLGAKRVAITMSELNLRSRRIPERLGFTLEGVLRNHRRGLDGQLDDTRIYARTTSI